MNRETLDKRIRIHKIVTTVDDMLRRPVVRKAEDRLSRIAWLESLVRAGEPLPDTPAGIAADAALQARAEAEEERLTRKAQANPSGYWDHGIWYTR
jgi:hypothetical protein